MFVDRAISQSKGTRYKWVVLSNTTLGILLASVNGSIILISLPAIFRGIHIDPLAPAESDIFLWTVMGYLVVSGTFMVSVGRISDMYGRIRFYNLGFLIFTIGSILLFFTRGQGNLAAIQIIMYRLIQAFGSAFLFANSAALLTDAFPQNQRGLALGLNQIAGVGGSLIGLILGGVLSSITYSLVFLVSVPVGIAGTIWSYLMLKQLGVAKRNQRVDVLGNIVFASGIVLVLVGLTYALVPYQGAPMGWQNPLVIGELAGGVLLLILFVPIERKVINPMFNLSLFRLRSFYAGIIAGLFSSIARGGLQLLLIIWLQGLWLPLNGYSYAQTPLWAGIALSPMIILFLLTGPISGTLADRFGAKLLAFSGMMLCSAGFLGLTLLPANFSYVVFVFVLALLGIGQGLFVSPNTMAIMNSLPAEHRGVGSGMLNCFQTSGWMFSIGVFFTLVIIGFSGDLKSSLENGLIGAGLPVRAAGSIANLPPTAALFAAFLGYNPMAHLLPHSLITSLPSYTGAVLLSTKFFPSLVSRPLMQGFHLAFLVAAIMSFLAAVCSLLHDSSTKGLKKA